MYHGEFSCALSTALMKLKVCSVYVCSTQNSDVPAPGNIEHLLHNTAEELLTGDFPEVSHSTLEATLGSYLGGCVTSPTGENHYIIPGLQHTYRWDATRAGAMIKDIIILFKMGIREHSLGYIQLYKCSKSMTSENLVSSAGSD